MNILFSTCSKILLGFRWDRYYTAFQSWEFPALLFQLSCQSCLRGNEIRLASQQSFDFIFLLGTGGIERNTVISSLAAGQESITMSSWGSKTTSSSSSEKGGLDLDHPSDRRSFKRCISRQADKNQHTSSVHTHNTTQYLFRTTRSLGTDIVQTSQQPWPTLSQDSTLGSRPRR